MDTIKLTIQGDVAMIEGAPIAPPDDGTDIHQHAIHHIALTHAQDSPAWVEATDEDGTTVLLVHPDGTTSQPSSPVDQPARANPSTLNLGPTAASSPLLSKLRTSPVPQVASDVEQTATDDFPAPSRKAPRLVSSTVAPEPASYEPPASSQLGNSTSFLASNSGHADDNVPIQGWRRLLARLGIRIEPTAAEIAEHQDHHALRTQIVGARSVLVANPKGGAGKTPTVAQLAAQFGMHGATHTVALDGNPTRGTLGWRTEMAPHDRTVTDLLAAARDGAFSGDIEAAAIHGYVHHQRADVYDVVRSNPLLLASSQALDSESYRLLLTTLKRFYHLIITDSGNDESTDAFGAMLDCADMLVVPTTTERVHVECARLLLESCYEQGGHRARLASSALIVVSQADPRAEPAAEVAERLAPLTRSVVTVPYDEALKEQWLVTARLAPATRRAWLAAAAEVARALT